MEWIRSVFTLALVATIGVRSQAENLLQTPKGTLKSGEPIELVLVMTNDTNEPVVNAPPKFLPLVIRAGSAAYSAVFRPDPPAVLATSLAPGGFRRTIYRGVLPKGLAGLVVLDASEVEAGRVAVDVAPAGHGSTRSPGVATTSTAAPAVDTRPPPPLIREFGFLPHEPLYFSFGVNRSLNARFQLSFKFRPVGPSDDRVAGRGTWEDVYLGFTQTSLWDLHSNSKPFLDSSYRPSLFYYREDIGTAFLGGRLGFAGGFEHESNGKGGADSRSINLLFARPTLRWGSIEGWHFLFSPKVYAYLDKAENPDIQRYRGYGDFQFAVVHPQSWKLATTLRIGTADHQGSVQIDASYPFPRLNDILPPNWVRGYLHLQYFNGWGETILNYNKRTAAQIRVGFMAIR